MYGPHQLLLPTDLVKWLSIIDKEKNHREVPIYEKPPVIIHHVFGKTKHKWEYTDRFTEISLDEKSLVGQKKGSFRDSLNNPATGDESL